MKRLSERTNEENWRELAGFTPAPVVSFDEEVPPNMIPSPEYSAGYGAAIEFIATAYQRLGDLNTAAEVRSMHKLETSIEARSRFAAGMMRAAEIADGETCGVCPPPHYTQDEDMAICPQCVAAAIRAEAMKVKP